MTTKKQTTKKAPVAKTATNVVSKATEQIKKPTIKSLQDEVNRLKGYKDQWEKAFGVPSNFDTIDGGVVEAVFSHKSGKYKAITVFGEVYVSKSFADDLTKQLSEQDNTPWTTITYQRFVRWLTNVTSYFKE